MCSHPVIVNALNMVVSMTTLDVSTRSCPMFLAITWQFTVVAEPGITGIATRSSRRKPVHTAGGRNRAANRLIYNLLSFEASGNMIFTPNPPYLPFPISIFPP